MQALPELPLRPAVAADEAAIQALIREARINPLGIDWRRFVVIESPDGQVAACGQIKPHSDGTQELASIVVRPEWQGRGLARRIIEHLLADCTGTLYLMCESSLRPLYEKFGFVVLPESDLPRYFKRMKFLMRLPEKMTGFEILIMKRDSAA